MSGRLTRAVMDAADWLEAVMPRAVPDQTALRNCKIISHRGEHDNLTVMENTLRAFTIARDNGVWGIECDIRWTADLVPVICHDPTGERVFGCAEAVGSLSFAALRERMPPVPSLQELVAGFGGKVHLMLELKAEAFPDPARQTSTLKDLLSVLAPGRDYHVLALDPGLFALVDFLPRRFCLPVAEANVSTMSRAAIEGDYGGLGGHFLLLTNALQRRHEAAGQRLGTGFVSSRNCLFRELNRGIEWIFSNDAVKIQAILDSYLQQQR